MRQICFSRTFQHHFLILFLVFSPFSLIQALRWRCYEQNGNYQTFLSSTNCQNIHPLVFKAILGSFVVIWAVLSLIWATLWLFVLLQGLIWAVFWYNLGRFAYNSDSFRYSLGSFVVIWAALHIGSFTIRQLSRLIWAALWYFYFWQLFGNLGSFMVILATFRTNLGSFTQDLYMRTLCLGRN